MSTAPPGSEVAPKGPPYAPTIQGLGASPSTLPDVPVCAVFLLLFILGAAAHMTLFRTNLSAGRKFIFSVLTFGFCMSRIVANILRIAWNSYPMNIRLAFAAQVFVYAGVVILFLVNLFFAQRIIRAQHPRFGWTKPFGLLFKVMYIIIICTIIMLIGSLVSSIYTLNPNSHRISRDLLLYSATFFAFVSFLPLPLIALSCAARAYPKSNHTKPIDNFGHGSMRVKIAIVVISALFLSTGAIYRAVTNWLPPVPLFSNTTPPKLAPTAPYFSKACFYIFNFTFEITVVYFWLAMRVDKRFIVPNGAKGPFSYGGGVTFAGEAGNEKRTLGNRDTLGNLPDSQGSGVGSRVSWGGISRDDVTPGLGEDGAQVLPYPGFEKEAAAAETGNSSADVGVEGADSEMGWDGKSGKWMLRPVSRGPSQVVHPLSTAPPV